MFSLIVPQIGINVVYKSRQDLVTKEPKNRLESREKSLSLEWKVPTL